MAFIQLKLGKIHYTPNRKLLLLIQNQIMLTDTTNHKYLSNLKIRPKKF